MNICQSPTLFQIDQHPKFEYAPTPTCVFAKSPDYFEVITLIKFKITNQPSSIKSCTCGWSIWTV